MQEIEYADGKKTKEFFESMFGALNDAAMKAQEEAFNKLVGNPIEKVTVTRVIPKKRK